MTYGYEDIGEKPFCKISEHTVITRLHYCPTNLLKKQQTHFCTGKVMNTVPLNPTTGLTHSLSLYRDMSAGNVG